MHKEIDIEGVTEPFILRQKANFWEKDPFFASLYKHFLDPDDQDHLEEKIEEMILFLKDVQTINRLRSI